MDVEAIELSRHDKDADIADGAEVDELTDFVLEKSLVYQSNKETLKKKKKKINN